MAHVTDKQLNFLKTQKLTKTHVIVNVTHLSLFGLLWSFLSKLRPKATAGQVLLLLRPPSERLEMDVFLLPVNVAPEEVKCVLC